MKRKKSSKKKDKILAMILTPIAFIMALFVSIMLGTLLVIWIYGNGPFIIETYYTHPEYFLSVFSFSVSFLVVFGVWFANEFYGENK